MTKSTSQELVALLVDEARIDPARLDEALHRQVVSGGALDTVLMEMGLVTEHEILRLLARASSLPAVSNAQLSTIEPGLVSVFPRRVAERHLMLPFERTGRRLSVAVSTLPKLEELDSIGFMLSVWIRPFITTEARLAQALRRAYDIPIPRRLENVLGLLGEDSEPEPNRAVHTASNAPASALQTSSAPLRPPSRPRARDDVVARRPISAASTSDATEPSTSAPANEEAAIEQVQSTRPAPWAVENTASLDAPLSTTPATRATAASSLLVAVGSADVAPSVLRDPPPPVPDDDGPSGAAAGLLRQLDEEALLVEKKKRARLEERVRWTVDDAIAELAMAGDRDGFVEVVLRFAHRRLSSVAMFVLTKSGDAPHFEGWDAIDEVWSFRDLSEIRIPTTGDHVLAKIHDMKSPFLGPIDPGDPLMMALGRRPRAAILVPVFVGQRLAAVLYGDCGAQSIPPSSLAELHMVVPRFGNALRNLIVRQKQAASGASPAREAERVLPAATVAGAIPVIELDIDDFDEISAETVIDSTDDALEHISLASGGSFSIPPIPADDIIIDVTDAPAARATFSPSTDERPPPLPRRRVVDTPAPSPVEPDPEATDRHPTPVNALGSPVTITGSGAVVTLDGDPESALADAASDTPLPAELAEFDDDTGNSDDDISTDEGSTLAELRRRRAAEQVAADVRAVADLAFSSLKTPAATPIVGARASDPSTDASGATDATTGEPNLHPVDAAHVDTAHASTSDEDPATRVEALDAPALRDDSAPDALALRDDSARDEVRAVDHVARPLLAEFSDLADDTMQPVASPGALAREALLLATHQAWLAHIDEEADALLLGLQTPGESGRATIGRIAALGDRAMPALARYFPGVLVEHPFSAMSTRPEARDLSDALAVLVRIGVERAAPILVAEVTHDDRLHRYAAVLGLAELIVPAALPRLAERVFDPEFRIALLALEVLPRYASHPGYERVQAQLRDLIRRGDDFQRRRAIVAATELHDRDAILTLADTLGTRPKEISDEAHRALIEITKRDLGTSTRRWRAWHDDNARSRRMEWLLQGLMQKETDIRRSAQTELNRLTGKYFGYRYDAPRNERDNAVLAWQRWWSEEADQSAWP